MLRSPGPGVKDPDHISGILNAAPNRDIRERARLRGDIQHVAQALMYENSYTAAGCSGLYGLTSTMAGCIYGRSPSAQALCSGSRNPRRRATASFRV